MKRREFVQHTTCATLSATTILQYLIEGALTKLHAEQSNTSSSKKLVTLFLAGGAPAWVYNLPLNPFGSQSVTSNASCANDFIGNQPVYSTVNVTINGTVYRMPKIWGATMPTTAGPAVPISTLLTNMAIIRGIRHPADGHHNCAIQVSRPDPAGLSLHGIVADGAPSSVPIPSIAGGNYSETMGRAYSSRKVGLVEANMGSQALQLLLQPFKPDTTMQDLLSRRDAFSTAFNSAIAAMKKKAVGIDSRMEGLYQSVANSEALFKKDFGNLATVWSQLKAKYEGLIAACTNINDILTESINPSGLTNVQKRNNVGIIATNSDLRNIVTPSTSVIYLAQSCAYLEFVLTNNLIQSANFYMTGPYNFTIQQTNEDGSSPMIQSTLYGELDQHYVGVGLAVPANTFYYRAVSACLYELITVLKASNIFDQTVIHLATEFTRSPLVSGAGSDHGFHAGLSSIISSSIKSPIIIGNIRQDAVDESGSSYAGTWGLGATVQHEGANNTYLNPGHAASSICAVLGVTSPTPNFQSVLTTTSTGDVVAAIDKGETRSV